MNSIVDVHELFESSISYPDVAARDRLAQLVGLDEHKRCLVKILGLLINPAGLEAWAHKHYPRKRTLVKAVLRRPPLIVLAGEVGSGKTELAETIGDTVARQEKIDITLLPLSLASRGQGRVGEMTQLLSAAFDHTLAEAKKLKDTTSKARGGLILLVDEADALAQSREAAQMHHEDRAGVNAFIRGIDRIANASVPVAVIMCTNRLGALDPAVKRRAADILVFERPDAEKRHEVLQRSLDELGFSRKDLEKLVVETGQSNGRNYGFTFSDLMQRLLPTIVLDAYPTGPIEPKRAIEMAHQMVPTPPFREGSA